MMENQANVMKYLGISEGGYVNHPDDPGGATNYGVTQGTYNAWRANRGLPIRSVKDISKREVERIFVQQYFAPVWFNKLPSGLDYAVVDYAINSGPGRAVKDLQRTLNEMHAGLSVDGAMGNNTLRAILSLDTVEIIQRLCKRRMAFLKRLRTWGTFGKGWTRRVMGNELGAQQYDTGVIDRATVMAEKRTVTNMPTAAPGKGIGDTGFHKKSMTGLGIAASGLGTAGASTIAGLGDTAQIILICGLVIAGLGLLWVFRNKIKEMAEG